MNRSVTARSFPRGGIGRSMKPDFAFSTDTVSTLVNLALEQAERDNALLQQIKCAVERRDVLEVFRLSEMLVGGDGLIAADTVEFVCRVDRTGSRIR